MASANRLWGAERIRGELLKLDIKVSKRTIQRYMLAARPRRPHGQRWSTFLRNHAHEIWACDFLQAYDVFFRPVFALVFIELATRKVVLAATTRFPSQAWVTQQLRNATPLGVAPRFLLLGHDNKFGVAFDALALATGIRVIRTAVRAPDMNAVCERFLGSLRRECLDHLLVLDDRHFQRVVAEYVRYHKWHTASPGAPPADTGACRVPGPREDLHLAGPRRAPSRLPTSRVKGSTFGRIGEVANTPSLHETQDPSDVLALETINGIARIIYDNIPAKAGAFLAKASTRAVAETCPIVRRARESGCVEKSTSKRSLSGSKPGTWTRPPDISGVPPAVMCLASNTASRSPVTPPSPQIAFRTKLKSRNGIVIEATYRSPD
jgi:hypothetical protein